MNTDILTMIGTPFETRLRVASEWIDINGHFHDANYIEAFNTNSHEFFKLLGAISPNNVSGFTIFNLGLDLDYVKEVFEGDPLSITTHLIDWDAKRIHTYSYMRHADTGALCATIERLYAHISLETRRTAPFSPEVYERIATVGAAHATLGKPDGVGRQLRIRRAESARR